MVTHLARGKKFGQGLGSTDLAPDPRINTIVKQVRTMKHDVIMYDGLLVDIKFDTRVV